MIDDTVRLHERLDDLFKSLAAIQESVTRIEARCGPCQKMVASHENTLHGNSGVGLVSRMVAVETGRVDTLSVKGFVKILGAVGAMAAAIGAAIGAAVKGLL